MLVVSGIAKVVAMAAARDAKTLAMGLAKGHVMHKHIINCALH